MAAKTDIILAKPADPLSMMARIDDARINQRKSALTLDSLSPENMAMEKQKASQNDEQAKVKGVAEALLPYISSDEDIATYNESMMKRFPNFGSGFAIKDSAHLAQIREQLNPKKQNNPELDAARVDLYNAQAEAARARANGQGGQPQEPLDMNDPLRSIGDAKERDKAIARRIAANEKELSGFDEAYQGMRATADSAKRFMGAYDAQKNDTFGSKPAQILPDFMAGFDDQMSAMDAESAKLTPAQRVAGSGTTSDRDMAFFRQATLGREKPEAVNRSIAMALNANAERGREMAEFFREYSDTNAGNLSGAKKIWNKYINSQSLFNENGTFNDKAKSFADWNSGGTTQDTVNANAMSHPKLGDISEDDILATMQKYNMPRDQVMKKLGMQ